MLNLKKLRATPDRPQQIDESYESFAHESFSLEGRVIVRGEAVYRQNAIWVRLKIEATAVQACSRCLAPVVSAVRLDELLEFRPLHTVENPLATEVYFYDFEEPTLDLQSYVIGLIANSLAVKPLCRPDCKGLCPQCGQDLNVTTCDCVREAPGDPRFKVLEKLL
ncbi:MAG: DUF177 domain-containing protein [Candidatus Bipolaricaulota bacterium]|nr:DUF177 domain-containing protein [Candidatus Bipolaricaulota bacterium]MDW8141236.1 DUF177 domain-containing protein [Candidatus Bipolaricaulota bacterium]